MKIINDANGKIGFTQVGPSLFLDEDIRLGEVAICIDRDQDSLTKPAVWLIGGVEQCIDVLSLAKEEDKISEINASLLLSKLDEIKKNIPMTPMQRMAKFLKMDIDELSDVLMLTQVRITNPIEGVRNYKDHTTSWSTGNTFQSEK